MKNFRYLNFLMMIYLVIVITCLVLFNKVIKFGPGVISGGVCAFPFTYLIGDIITEVYGYKYTRQLIWLSSFSIVFAAILINIIIYLPSPAFDQSNQAFLIAFAHTLRYSFSGAIAFWSAEFANAFVISKWKILVKGQFFWIRSIGSSFVGELTNTLVVFSLSFLGLFSTKQLFIMIGSMYLYKFIVILICVTPANFLVAILKIKEGMDQYDVGINFNPFSLATDAQLN